MIIVQTPLRISFFGGGTDFPAYYLNEGGCTLSSAINKSIYVIVKQRFDDLLRIGYTQTEIVENVSEIRHELIREALKLTGINNGVEIITMGDIPAGTGLGSSSAVTVGALNAMYAYLDQFVPAERLAREACHIEIDTLKKPIGIQDQYITAYGGLRFFQFNQDGNVAVDKMILNARTFQRFSENLLLFYTGTTRQASSILAEQNGNTRQNLTILRKIKELALKARIALYNGMMDDIGDLLHESWMLKKQLAKGISNPIIEEAYQKAREAGALGGKVTGAGGGGFLLLYCPIEKKENVRAAVSNLRELPFELDPHGTRVIFRN